MSIRVTASSLDAAIAKELEKYADQVFAATEDGLDAAESVLLRNLEAASPKRTPSKTGLSKNWTSSKRKYKMARYVGNSTTVKSRGKSIPLLNILEYSTEHGHPFVRKIFDASTSEMATAMVAAIKKEV